MTAEQNPETTNEEEWEAAFETAPAEKATGTARAGPEPGTIAGVRETTLSELESEDTGAGSERNLDFLLDIPLEVSVELGRTSMLVADLLRLSQGSVVELAKNAGEPLDILVNRKLVARGEVVVVNDRFGIRLTDVISHAERVKQLG
jgi:flagellar motor switch protein FliN/FliY